MARGDRTEVQAVGSVDIEVIEPCNVPGRYGWIGGTGTAAHLTASTGTVTILLSQLELAGPAAPALVPSTHGTRDGTRVPCLQHRVESEPDSPLS